MTMSREDILTILAQNIESRGSAFPLAPTRLTEWSRGLGLPRGGKTVLYTGHMYQMMPYLKGLQQRQEKWPILFKGGKIARFVNPFVNLTAIITMGAAPMDDREFYYQVLRNVVNLLRGCAIEFGYLYKEEDYAGTLAYDLGLDRAFERHAARVYRRLKNHGVKELITVDPHTTDILKNVYPQVVEGFDIEVKHYLEILAERWPSKTKTPGGGPVVVHDSCVCARYLNMIQEPRHLLSSIGISTLEPELSGKNTHCCGGPVESLYPEKARDIARNRMDQLKNLGETVVTMCPICHLNLVNATENHEHIIDIANLLIRRKEE